MEKAARKTLKQSGIPRKERKWIVFAIIAGVLLLAWGLWSMLQLSTNDLHSRMFERTFKNYGSNARIALFVVLANYVLAWVIRKGVAERLLIVKKTLISLLRLAKTWHTPAAIVAIAFILLHAAAVFMYGFKYDFNNMSGLLALLVLLPVPVSGLFRYKRLDRKWHLRLGLAFAVLFLIHAFL